MRSATGACAALERAAEGLGCKTAVHICYGYGIQANIDWKGTLGAEWRQYEQMFPALAKSRIDQVSLECRNSHVPMALMRLLAGKDVLVGVIDVATDRVETPEEVADTIAEALAFVPAERLFPCTNCGPGGGGALVAAAAVEGARRGRQCERARRAGGVHVRRAQERLHPPLPGCPELRCDPEPVRGADHPWRQAGPARRCDPVVRDARHGDAEPAPASGGKRRQGSTARRRRRS